MFVELMGFHLFMCFGIRVSLVLYFSIFSTQSYIIASLFFSYGKYMLKEKWKPDVLFLLSKKTEQQKKRISKERVKLLRASFETWYSLQIFVRAYLVIDDDDCSKQWSQWCCTWTKLCIHTENCGLDVYCVGKSTLLDYFSFLFWIKFYWYRNCISVLGFLLYYCQDYLFL